MKKYYKEIIDAYERESRKMYGVSFADDHKEALAQFLKWLDKNKIAVWKDD